MKCSILYVHMFVMSGQVMSRKFRHHHCCLEHLNEVSYKVWKLQTKSGIVKHYVARWQSHFAFLSIGKATGHVLWSPVSGDICFFLHTFSFLCALVLLSSGAGRIHTCSCQQLQGMVTSFLPQPGIAEKNDTWFAVINLGIVEVTMKVMKKTEKNVNQLERFHKCISHKCWMLSICVFCVSGNGMHLLTAYTTHWRLIPPWLTLHFY